MDNWIWVGRRLGYLWRYREAIDIYTQALAKFPHEPAFYRHRGHRFITLRRFDRAIADLEKAARLIEGQADQIEADGMPNAAGIPTSTLHTNIWYHLGLAFYLTQRYPQALKAYEACLDASKNDDMKVATLDWMFMTLMRMGNRSRAMEVIAVVGENTKVIENVAYLRRIRMYRGLIQPQDLLTSGPDQDEELNLATYGYALGNWYQMKGQSKVAEDYYRRVIAGTYWSAFGYIAAETELARLQAGKPETNHKPMMRNL